MAVEFRILAVVTRTGPLSLANSAFSGFRKEVPSRKTALKRGNTELGGRTSRSGRRAHTDVSPPVKRGLRLSPPGTASVTIFHGAVIWVKADSSRPLAVPLSEDVPQLGRCQGACDIRTPGIWGKGGRGWGWENKQTWRGKKRKEKKGEIKIWGTIAQAPWPKNREMGTVAPPTPTSRYPSS